MTRQLQRALMLAAAFALSATAQADNRGFIKKKEYSGHTIQDCLEGHTIQDCNGDRLSGGVTWDGGGGVNELLITGDSYSGEAGSDAELKRLLSGYSSDAIGVIDPVASDDLFAPTSLEATDEHVVLLTTSGSLDLADLGHFTPAGATPGEIVATAYGVPAPGALPLLGLGVAALFGRRRRK